MTREEYQKTIKTFTKEQQRLKSLKKGQKIYVTDLYYDFFKCEVVSVDLKKGTVKAIDHSYPEKPIKELQATGFWTEKEAQDYWKTDEFKYKMF